jgi:hypothetical protein
VPAERPEKEAPPRAPGEAAAISGRAPAAAAAVLVPSRVPLLLIYRR